MAKNQIQVNDLVFIIFCINEIRSIKKKWRDRM